VQGKGREAKLAPRSALLQPRGHVDVIVLTRGGGSLEDLWPFNEELLCPSRCGKRNPTVSAVGHE
jgi:exodeoxyribonuclease VII large subunit